MQQVSSWGRLRVVPHEIVRPAFLDAVPGASTTPGASQLCFGMGRSYGDVCLNEGGRLIETVRDGTEHVWGTVTQWKPGQRLAFTWHLQRAPATAQLVDVTFVAQGAQTRVTLTHGGWERREDGAKARANYVGGWKIVLGERYRGFCEHAVRT
jgi:hypothetical protein